MACLITQACPVQAAGFQIGFSQFLVAEGLRSPTAMEFAPDGRLFVCEQEGALRVIKDMTLLPAPFVTVAVNTNIQLSERGLLGIAFAPDFPSNHFLYVYYTAFRQENGTNVNFNRVSRFTADGDLAVPGSELPILNLDPPARDSHNGGAIHFGPDGKLYIGVGDHGRSSNGTNLSTRAGKILRINPDGSIPTDNPFYTIATNENRAIWAFGLRNPFTFAIEPGTGRVFINDVGDVLAEEINEGLPGGNYGWPVCEGPCGKPGLRDPIYAYGRGQFGRYPVAITGGTFYRPVAAQFPKRWHDSYFFTDLFDDSIHRLNLTNNAVTDFVTGLLEDFYSRSLDLKVSAEGRLCYLTAAGQVWAVEYTNGPPVLGLIRTGSDLRLLWAAPSPNYVLESSSTVPNTNSWTTATNAIVTANGRHEVNLAAHAPARFFRLRRVQP